MSRLSMAAAVAIPLLCSYPGRAQEAAPGQHIDKPEKATTALVAPAGIGQARGQAFEVSINGNKGGTWVLVEYQGELYASREAFIQWRIEPSPAHPPLAFRRATYHSLGAIPGYTAKVDRANQAVEINFAPDAFAETRYGNASLKRAIAAPALPSLFLNYELNYQRSDMPGTALQQNVGLLGEAGFSAGQGVFVTSFLAQQLQGGDSQPGFVRLETNFTHDFPESNRSLQIGDSATRMGLLGSSVFFGGFRLGTDFSLTPGFVQQNLPIARGVSSAPSTVDLYVNNVLRQSTQVATGPFTIENLPPMTGAGEVRMVVRDVFGRESVITRSFFSSNRLLARGLSDWSVEGGRIRHDLGLPTSYYGEPFARAMLRHGLTEYLTLEGVGEYTPKQKNSQLAIATPLGQWLAGAGLATSHSADNGSGYRWLASLEQSGLRHGVSLQFMGSSRQYRTLAAQLPTSRSQISANASYATGESASLGLGYTAMRDFDDQKIVTQSANYSFRLGSRSTLSFIASRSTGAGVSGNSIGLTLVIPFDKGPTAIVSTQRRGAETDLHASLTEHPTQKNPLGWRTVLGRQQGVQREEAGLHYRNRNFQLIADASHDATGMNAQRLSLSGGLVYVGGEVFALRESMESLALVEVPGYARIGVGLNNNNERRTGANGTALVPNLLAYQENAITLNPQDLPISAELDSIEQIAVPGRRSVIRVRFPVRQGQGALLKIVLGDGKPPPAGATIRLRGETREFFVARRGEVFVTGLQASNELILKHPAGECAVQVSLPPAAPQKILRLGPLQCLGVEK